MSLALVESNINNNAIQENRFQYGNRFQKDERRKCKEVNNEEKDRNEPSEGSSRKWEGSRLLEGDSLRSDALRACRISYHNIMNLWYHHPRM